jgi:hypothetical protein
MSNAVQHKFVINLGAKIKICKNMLFCIIKMTIVTCTFEKQPVPIKLWGN